MILFDLCFVIGWLGMNCVICVLSVFCVAVMILDLVLLVLVMIVVLLSYGVMCVSNGFVCVMGVVSKMRLVLVSVLCNCVLLLSVVVWLIMLSDSVCLIDVCEWFMLMILFVLFGVCLCSVWVSDLLIRLMLKMISLLNVKFDMIRVKLCVWNDVCMWNFRFWVLG